MIAPKPAIQIMFCVAYCASCNGTVEPVPVEPSLAGSWTLARPTIGNGRWTCQPRLSISLGFTTDASTDVSVGIRSVQTWDCVSGADTLDVIIPATRLVADVGPVLPPDSAKLWLRAWRQLVVTVADPGFGPLDWRLEGGFDRDRIRGRLTLTRVLEGDSVPLGADVEGFADRPIGRLQPNPPVHLSGATVFKGSR